MLGHDEVIVKVEGDLYRRRASMKHGSESSADSPSETPLLRIETEFEFMKSFTEKSNASDGGFPMSFDFLPGGNTTKSRCASSIKRTFPVADWLPKYDWRNELLRDVMVGVTLGFVIAPKAMAHALLAELSPIHGIYTAFFSTLVYGTMGLSKWLSLGTCALPALLFGDALSAVNLPTVEDNGLVSSLLTFYIGVWTLVMFLLRLDRLVVLIPPPVLAAFTTTAAFLIATSQVKYLLGLHIKASGFVQTYIAVFQHISEVNPATVIMSIGCIIYLFISKKLTARYLRKYRIPDTGAMVVVLATIALVFFFDLDTRFNIDTAGHAPSGMPAFHLPWEFVSDASLHGQFIVEGAVIAVINFVLMIAIAKSFAKRSKSNIRVSQELKALGGVNLIGSFFGAQVAGGSFSGSAIIASLQASTMLHNFVNSFVMMLILLFLTPVIEILPKCTLAAIIVVALPSLVNFKKPVELYRVKTDDFLLWVGTFLITLFAGVQWGIISGVSLSLIALIRRNIGSDCTELGVLPGTTIYRSIDRFPDAIRFDGIRMFRLDASLSFANFEKFEQHLQKVISDHLGQSEGKPIKPSSINQDVATGSEEKQQEAPPISPRKLTIILSCEAVNDIDTSAISMMCQFARQCEEHDIRLLFSGWKCQVRQTLYSAHEQYIKANKIKIKQEQEQAQDPDIELQEEDEDSEVLPTPDMVAVEGCDIAKPALLDPNCWFLNLHDAVYRAKDGLLVGFPPSTGGSPGQYSDGEDPGQVAWPRQDTKSSEKKQRTNSTPVTTRTTEVTPGGDTRTWNYAAKHLDNPRKS